MRRATNQSLLAAVCAAALQMICQPGLAATITLTPSADTFTRPGVNAGSAGVLNAFGNATGSFVSYFRWDLAPVGIDTITSATVTFHKVQGSRNDTYTTGRFANFGLTNAAGNTPQNWDEATLAEANAGLEFTNVNMGVDVNQVFNLDADRGAMVTESRDAGPPEVLTLSGADLVTFLNGRLADGGLATILAAVDANNGRGWGYGSRENADPSLTTTLTIEYTTAVPEPGSLALLGMAALALLGYGRMRN